MEPPKALSVENTAKWLRGSRCKQIAQTNRFHFFPGSTMGGIPLRCRASGIRYSSLTETTHGRIDATQLPKRCRPVRERKGVS
jgi:hypothetical protein